MSLLGYDHILIISNVLCYYSPKSKQEHNLQTYWNSHIFLALDHQKFKKTLFKTNAKTCERGKAKRSK